MDDKKQLVPSIIIGIVGLLLVGVVYLKEPSSVSVSVAPAGSPVTVSPQGTPVVVSGQSGVEQSFGASSEVTTNWTAGAFSSDLSVGGNLNVTGTSLFTGTSTFTGPIVPGSSGFTVPLDRITSFTSVTTSQALCSIVNNTGANRVLDNVNLVYATSSVTGGSIPLTISQSTTAATTGTQLFFSGSVTAPANGLTDVTPTSTLAGSSTTAPGDATKAIWYSGRFINFITNGATNTFAGTCRVTSY